MGLEHNQDNKYADPFETMGASLNDLYEILSNQVSFVHFKWEEYRTLFGTNYERLDFLNVAAPSFFAVLQQLLWDDMLLHICRLTDPPKSVGKANLTVACLPPLISNAQLSERVTTLFKDAKEKARFAREWRNRRLAHREFPVADNVDSCSLNPGSQRDIEEALTALRTVMNCIQAHYMKPTPFYEEEFEPIGGVHDLLECLEKGVEGKRRHLGQ